MRVSWILSLTGAVALTATAGEPAAEAQELRHIVLVPVNLTDTALVHRIVGFAQANCPAEIVVSEPQAFNDLDAQKAMAAALKKNRRKGVRDGVIVLLGSPSDTNAHGFYDPRVEAGVVNIPALSVGVGGDRERYCRRIERQVMRIIGMLLGLSPCPNPRCVMHHYRTLDELDEMGRNFCPPCLGRLEEAVAAKGYATWNVGRAAVLR
ncbi:MAG TPA: hypothetical protein ENG36_00345 [Lentisphaerae bacterium]|nr:MAG: hypothetical protein DRP22_03250 [Verrucomicrobiota bacterium]HDL77202.1 hypothetical protein [Lentisphaerota bacterium]